MAQNGDRFQGLIVNTMQRSRYSDKTPGHGICRSRGLEALLANRGFAIDKGGGALRPFGVGEMVRRIIGKAIMTVTGEKVQEAVGALQLCEGQPAGVEAAIHAMRKFLDDDESDGI